MQLEFCNLNNNPASFFAILPKDWQSIIVPKWEHYKKYATIYGFKDNNQIIAGGIVFTIDHPNKTPLEIKYNHLYTEAYFYIGYIWIIPSKRNQKLATKWLTNLKELNKSQKYWLTIEEESLKHFYKKNHFKLLNEPVTKHTKEWILTYSPKIMS